VSSLDKNSPNL